MRKIIVSNVMTLDGFFESVDRKIDWFPRDNEFFDYAKDMLRHTDTLLFGRLTYEVMEAYWPSTAVDEIAEKMNNLAKVVVSTTLQTANWNNSSVVNGDVIRELSKLKQLAAKDIVLLGSARLSSFLLQAGLIDEYRIVLAPVMLGQGNPLFPDVKKKLRMKLERTKLLGSGMAILYYQPLTGQS